MTEQFLFNWDGKDPLELYGIGKYGADSFNMFVKGYLVQDAKDKELRKYVEWVRGRGARRDPEEGPHPDDGGLSRSDQEVVDRQGEQDGREQ